MTKPIDMFLAGKPSTEIVQAIAQLPDSGNGAHAPSLNSTQLSRLGPLIATAVRKANVQCSIVIGGLLSYYRDETDSDEHRVHFTNLCDDLGIDEKRASDFIVKFRYFGRVLLEEPELTKRICDRALRMLSNRGTPEEAREKALERARRGEQVRIEDAKKLISDYTVEAEVSEESAPSSKSTDICSPITSAANRQKANPSGPPRKYVMEAVEFHIKPRSQAAQLDFVVVLRDAKLLVSRLERACD